MAATRLSDSQKQELVARFRGGEASGALAEAYGCSANTVSRVVRTALDPKEYEALKQQRGRSPVPIAEPAGGSSLQLPLPAAGSGEEAAATSTKGESAPEASITATGLESVTPLTPSEALAREEASPRAEASARAEAAAITEAGTRANPEATAEAEAEAEAGAPQAGPSLAPSDLASDSGEADLAEDRPQFGSWLHQQEAGVGQTSAPRMGAPGADPQDSPAGDQGHATLAIDDADDFADDDGDDSEGEGEGEDEGEGDDDGDSFLGSYGDRGPGDGQTFVVLPLGQTIEDRPSLTVQPLEPANLPASVYMLVDKTVELDIKPLKELPELGALPDGEGERQALVVYANPRQAKRYCGRNQRVIKVPDSGVLARTAPYLLSQGVTRLVVEGALYSLPGS